MDYRIKPIRVTGFAPADGVYENQHGAWLGEVYTNDQGDRSVMPYADEHSEYVPAPKDWRERIIPDRPIAPRVPMAPTGIATLNKAVRRLVKAGSEPAQAVVQAARDAGLYKVREYDQSGVLYRTQRNRYVFGWTNSEAGFDDQIGD